MLLVTVTGEVDALGCCCPQCAEAVRVSFSYEPALMTEPRAGVKPGDFALCGVCLTFSVFDRLDHDAPLELRAPTAWELSNAAATIRSLHARMRGHS